MTDTPNRTLPVGTRIGVYEIRRVLGAGRIGFTYEAWNKHLNSSMVLKEYFPRKLVSRAADGCTVIPKPAGDKTLFQSGLESFLAEAEYLIGLEHPNLVRVQNMLQLYGTAYQLMEYENGVALSDLIARPETRLDEEQLKVILSPILEALQEVHGAGFFHGDIHPGNILLRADGDPILLEFAITRLAMAESSAQRSWVLTEGYAPAEQYDPEIPMGSWTDLYALGATMYRCITGEVPVFGPERFAAQSKGAADPQISLQARAVAGYSKGFLDCIDSMLNPVAEKRPLSAAAVMELLAGEQQEQANKDLKKARNGSAGGQDIDSTEPLNRIPVPVMAGVGLGVVALITAGLWHVNQGGGVIPIQNEENPIVEMDESKSHPSRMTALDEQASENRDDTQGMGYDTVAVQEGAKGAVTEHSEQQKSVSTERITTEAETAGIDQEAEIPIEAGVATVAAYADDPVFLNEAQDAQVADEVVTDVFPEAVVEAEPERPTAVLRTESSGVLSSAPSQDGEDAPASQTAVSASDLQPSSEEVQTHDQGIQAQLESAQNIVQSLTPEDERKARQESSIAGVAELSIAQASTSTDTEASSQAAEIAQVQEGFGDTIRSSIASPSNAGQSQLPPDAVITKIVQAPTEVQEEAERMALQQEIEVISEKRPPDQIDVPEDVLVSAEESAPNIPSAADETSEAVTGMVSASQDPLQQEGVHDFITERMALAEENLLALRLTTPQRNNALEHYRAVLALLPDHSGALAGLQRIVDMYAWMIDTALQKGQLAMAQLYLTRADEVIPGAPSLLRAKQELRAVEDEATYE